MRDIDKSPSAQVIFCARCLTPNTRPRVEFNSDGVCNACRNAGFKDETDWGRRRDEFLALAEQLRPDHGPYDCIVPWSGGKDSSAIAHKLKFSLGLNPLLVTASPLIPNEVAVHNREEMLKLGFDHILVRPDQRVARHLARRFFEERGNPKVHWEASKEAIPLQVAARFRIPLVIYAEHGESEYGGRVLNEESRKIRDFTEVLEHVVGDDARNWVDESVASRDLGPYIYPEAGELSAVGVTAVYFSYFFRWSMFENYQYIKEKIDFMTAVNGRTAGTFTNFDSLDDRIDTLYYYLQHIKFGFGRASRDASRMIQNGHMTREKGLRLAREYDAEFPAADFPSQLDYLGLSEEGFHEIVDRHRNAEIWRMDENGQWLLRNQVC